MDPNETLRMLRLTIKQLRVDEDSDVWEAHANEICEYVEALDDWLTNGGFLPADWSGHTLSLAEVRDGTGFAPGVRFRLA